MKYTILLSMMLVLLLGCASKKSCNCKVRQPKDQEECLQRVSFHFGKSAKADPGVDLNYDGKITGVDWTLCRELNE